MKKFTTIFLLIAVVIINTSCKKDLVGEGPVMTETRTVTGFTGIDLRMNGNVYYHNDSTWKLEVTAKKSIHAMLETQVINNHLVIRYSNGKTYDEDESIRINVSGPGLSSFELNTSGSIYVLNAIHPTNLFLRSSGSGNISLQQVETNNIQAESLVSGKISVAAGIATSENTKTDASGRIDFAGLTAKSVTARIIGSGDIAVKVTDQLNATIDGSGSVFFRGNPFVSAHINGSGRVVRF